MSDNVYLLKLFVVKSLKNGENLVKEHLYQLYRLKRHSISTDLRNEGYSS